MSFTLAELAQQTDSELVGDGTCVIDNVADISRASLGSIAFVSDLKYKKYLTSTKASALIVTSELQSESSVPVLVTDNPRLLYAKIANLLFPAQTHTAGISPHAVIDDSAVVSDSACICAGVVISANVTIGENSYIGSGTVIGHDAVIDRDTEVHANVTIGHHCKVGASCTLHSGAVLGADGFGFVRDGDGERVVNIKIPQTGVVVLGDNVEIGACTTIDRGALENTVIGDGVKLDNQIQIAHSVQIGDNTVISAGSAIAGSTTIGKNCMIGGLVGIREHLEITDNVMITAQTLITHSIKQAGSYSSGAPMEDTRSWRKNTVRFRQLDKMARKITELEKQLDKLNNTK